jgi:hypothetical protein
MKNRYIEFVGDIVDGELEMEGKSILIGACIDCKYARLRYDGRCECEGQYTMGDIEGVVILKEHDGYCDEFIERYCND